MKIRIMKNIFLLPINKPSRIYEFGGHFTLTNEPTSAFRNLNIYITSDEEIEGRNCWVTNGEDVFKPLVDYSLEYANRYWKKIILTTDQDLINDGVQAIDDEFLEWFVKNPSCEEVETVFACRGFNGTIPNLIPIGEYKIIIPIEEPKQETLGEAAENFVNSTRLRNYKVLFMEGAKWQAEQNNTSKINRVEVIQHSPPYNGRAYTNYNAKDVEIQLQDDGRTLKIFLK
jgi:hypothetical protein